MIRVMIADDDALIREGLRMILDQAPDIEVVAVAENGSEALRQVGPHRPDVILMDIRMPELDGLEATRRLLASSDHVKIIILTTFELDEYVFQALRAGASGFLLKRIEPERLIEAISVVARGEALLAPSVTKRVIEEISRRQRSHQPELLAALTTREKEVLEMIARGLSNDELSEQLFISANTVKTHVKRILLKLGARDRAQAVVMAYEAGLVT